MILEYEKKVNPNLLQEELQLINTGIFLTTHGDKLLVEYPNGVIKQDIINTIESHEFITEDSRELAWIQSIKAEFNSASTLNQMKTVLGKIFKKIYKKGWD